VVSFGVVWCVRAGVIARTWVKVMSVFFLPCRWISRG
jgi:hypothetical protein